MESKSFVYTIIENLGTSLNPYGDDIPSLTTDRDLSSYQFKCLLETLFSCEKWENVVFEVLSEIINNSKVALRMLNVSVIKRQETPFRRAIELGQVKSINLLLAIFDFFESYLE